MQLYMYMKLHFTNLLLTPIAYEPYGQSTLYVQWQVQGAAGDSADLSKIYGKKVGVWN
jgi:hypothetical protein